MYESIITNELSYGYIINDISYQCCAYSYTFERIFAYFRTIVIRRVPHIYSYLKLVQACTNS